MRRPFIRAATMVAAAMVVTPYPAASAAAAGRSVALLDRQVLVMRIARHQLPAVRRIAAAPATGGSAVSSGRTTAPVVHDESLPRPPAGVGEAAPVTARVLREHRQSRVQTLPALAVRPDEPQGVHAVGSELGGLLVRLRLERRVQSLAVATDAAQRLHHVDRANARTARRTSTGGSTSRP